MVYAMGFAEHLCALMAEREMSGQQLARLVPCHPSLVCHYRRGRKRPSAKMAKLFDMALGAGGELAGTARAEAGPDLRSVLAGGLLAGGVHLVRQARGPVRPALLNVAEGWAQFGGWLCRNTADYAGAAVSFGHA